MVNQALYAVCELIDFSLTFKISRLATSHLSGGEAACTNCNADGRNAEPVEQGENLIDAADQGQRWHDDADWEHFGSEPSPERQHCNQQQAKAVARV
jgi:hypothetical protein